MSNCLSSLALVLAVLAVGVSLHGAEGESRTPSIVSATNILGGEGRRIAVLTKSYVSGDHSNKTKKEAVGALLAGKKILAKPSQVVFKVSLIEFMEGKLKIKKSISLAHKAYSQSDEPTSLIQWDGYVGPSRDGKSIVMLVIKSSGASIDLDVFRLPIKGDSEIKEPKPVATRHFVNFGMVGGVSFARHQDGVIVIVRSKDSLFDAKHFLYSEKNKKIQEVKIAAGDEK